MQLLKGCFSQDSKNVKTILNLTPPKSKLALQDFLEMISESKLIKTELLSFRRQEKLFAKLFTKLQP